MKKKLNALMVLLLIAVLIIGGCTAPKEETAETTKQKEKNENGASEASDEDKKLTFGYVMMTMNNEYCLQQKKGIEMKAEELGIDVIVQAPQSSEGAAEQLAFVETFLAQGVDGILIMQSSSEGLLTGVKKAQDAGVPLISLDQRFDPNYLIDNGLEPVPYIGTDNYTGGGLIGEFVKENFAEGTKTVIIEGIEGSSTNSARQNGFFDYLGWDEDCYVDVVASQNANWEVEQGYTVMQNILSANPDIELVFALCDTMGQGALRAIEETGRADEIQIIAYDGNPEALNLVEQGKFLADGGQHPGLQGELGVEYLRDWIMTGNKPPQDTDTGVTVVTQDNIAEYRQKNAKYTSEMD